MSDTEKSGGGDADLQRLAKEYVDLWEQQIKAFSNDEALARTVAQTMELMTAGTANVAAMMQKAAGENAGADSERRESDNRSEYGAGAGAETAGTAPGDPEPDVHELALRVAELERRLARLEGLSGPAGKVAPRKTK
ncbi:MAG: hypothetical protein JJ900_00730 [Rhodospirillales bacterium]|nr:hypothetical protein [Rhodospirillales bacterium]MBO6785342.1 hypothetical protein [Rhodospirillales bacterium]